MSVLTDVGPRSNPHKQSLGPCTLSMQVQGLTSVVHVNGYTGTHKHGEGRPGQPHSRNVGSSLSHSTARRAVTQLPNERVTGLMCATSRSPAQNGGNQCMGGYNNNKATDPSCGPGSTMHFVYATASSLVGMGWVLGVSRMNEMEEMYGWEPGI